MAFELILDFNSNHSFIDRLNLESNQLKLLPYTMGNLKQLEL